MEEEVARKIHSLVVQAANIAFGENQEARSAALLNVGEDLLQVCETLERNYPELISQMLFEGGGVEWLHGSEYSRDSLHIFGLDRVEEADVAILKKLKQLYDHCDSTKQKDAHGLLIVVEQCLGCGMFEASTETLAFTLDLLKAADDPNDPISSDLVNMRMRILMRLKDQATLEFFEEVGVVWGMMFQRWKDSKTA